MKEEKNPVISMIDNETGEVINEVYEGDSIRITRKESKDYLLQKKKEEEELVVINQGKRFTKFMEDAGEKLAKANLTSNQYRLILGINDYIEYETGLLKVRKGRYAGKLLTASDIMEICGLNEKYPASQRTWQ